MRPIQSDNFKITNTPKLDRLLVRCLELLLKKRKERPEYWGLVAACVLDTDNRAVFGVNHITKSGTRKHAERVAIERYEKKYGPVPAGSIIITTLSPCSASMSERWGDSCTSVINDTSVGKVYCGYEDPTQSDNQNYLRKQFHTKTTRNKHIRALCKQIADSFLDKELSESAELDNESELNINAKKITDFLFNTSLAIQNINEANNKAIGPIKKSTQSKLEYLRTVKQIARLLGEGLYADVFQHPVYNNVVVKIFDGYDLKYLRYLNEFVIPNQNNKYVPKVVTGTDGRIVYRFRLKHKSINIVFIKKYDSIQKHRGEFPRYMDQLVKLADGPVWNRKLTMWNKNGILFPIINSFAGSAKLAKEDPDMYNLARYLVTKFKQYSFDIHIYNIMWDSELKNPIITDPVA